MPFEHTLHAGNPESLRLMTQATFAGQISSGASRLQPEFPDVFVIPGKKKKKRSVNPGKLLCIKSSGNFLVL